MVTIQLKARTNAGVTPSNCDSEEELDDLLTNEDQNNSEQENNSDMELQSNKDDNSSTNRGKSPIKLLLSRIPWLIIGLLILVTGVILSQYRIHLPYHPATAASCSVDVINDNNTDVDEMNFTNSSTVIANFYRIL